MVSRLLFLSTLLLLSSTWTEAQSHKSHKSHKPHKKHKKPKFEHVKKGGVMKFCPNATDCAQMVILKMDKLQEVDSAGESVGNKVSVIKDTSFEWTSPITESIDGVNRTKVEFESHMTVGDATTPTHFHLVTYIYDTNATAQNANQTLSIPEGAFKFSLNITNWPWKSSNNSLQFGLRTKIISREGNWTRAKGKLNKHKNHKPNVDKVDFGGGVSLESPALCDRDGLPATLNSTIEAANEDEIQMDWTFPYFEKYLFYDPVLSVDEVEDSVLEDSVEEDSVEDRAMTMTLPAFLTVFCLMLVSKLFV